MSQILLDINYTQEALSEENMIRSVKLKLKICMLNMSYVL